MTLTIGEKDDDLLMIVGTTGGSTIINFVLQTILKVVEFDMGMQEAVDAPCFYHQWLPEEVVFGPGFFALDLLNQLRNKG